MKALSTSVVIHVSDLDRALNYYKDTLGFREDFKLEAYAGLELDNVFIHLSGPANPGRKKTPGSAHFCIECDEVDDYFDTISKKGAFIDVPLEDRFYGMRDFAVNDHDGNTLVFGKAL
ncbi:VOC family protein [Chitinophaga sp. SYP-B3965]|uniref:VOC family protein n=1 Tax=Chitinophaga sp. SYP-B3965 TaxID=2663120 RepID=UPI00129A06D9|nr:VOC family protein [Chitinophaga sp. SYP-B3965]MRG48639.1 VOC family protein [Chitinophaga sp. SYP-B3965]